MTECTADMCRGGMSCCTQDPILGVYCLTETSCNPNSSTVVFFLILLLLLLASVGVALVLYCKLKGLATSSFTMANFVDQ